MSVITRSNGESRTSWIASAPPRAVVTCHASGALRRIRSRTLRTSGSSSTRRTVRIGGVYGDVHEGLGGGCGGRGGARRSYPTDSRSAPGRCMKQRTPPPPLYPLSPPPPPPPHPPPSPPSPGPRC